MRLHPKWLLENPRNGVLSLAVRHRSLIPTYNRDLAVQREREKAEMQEFPDEWFMHLMQSGYSSRTVAIGKKAWTLAWSRAGWEQNRSEIVSAFREAVRREGGVESLTGDHICSPLGARCSAITPSSLVTMPDSDLNLLFEDYAEWFFDKIYTATQRMERRLYRKWKEAEKALKAF